MCSLLLLISFILVSYSHPHHPLFSGIYLYFGVMLVGVCYENPSEGRKMVINPSNLETSELAGDESNPYSSSNRAFFERYNVGVLLCASPLIAAKVVQVRVRNDMLYAIDVRVFLTYIPLIKLGIFFVRVFRIPLQSTKSYSVSSMRRRPFMSERAVISTHQHLLPHRAHEQNHRLIAAGAYCR